jgi:hypothetical protein
MLSPPLAIGEIFVISATDVVLSVMREKMVIAVHAFVASDPRRDRAQSLFFTSVSDKQR